MNKKTLKALQGSIEKWEKILAGTGEDEGSRNCPLCQLFVLKTWLCDGCPVHKVSGRDECHGTPYRRQWWPAVKGQRGPYKANTPRQKAAAQAEVDFLKSLLPKDEG